MSPLPGLQLGDLHPLVYAYLEAAATDGVDHWHSKALLNRVVDNQAACEQLLRVLITVRAAA